MLRAFSHEYVDSVSNSWIFPVIRFEHAFICKEYMLLAS